MPAVSSYFPPASVKFCHWDVHNVCRSKHLLPISYHTKNGVPIVIVKSSSLPPSHSNTHTHTHTQTNIHIVVPVDLGTSLLPSFKHTHTNTHTHTHTNIHIVVPVDLGTSLLPSFKHTHTNKHIHTNTHIHTHTQTNIHTYCGASWTFLPPSHYTHIYTCSNKHCTHTWVTVDLGMDFTGQADWGPWGWGTVEIAVGDERGGKASAYVGWYSGCSPKSPFSIFAHS